MSFERGLVDTYKPIESSYPMIKVSGTSVCHTWVIVAGRMTLMSGQIMSIFSADTNTSS